MSADQRAPSVRPAITALSVAIAVLFLLSLGGLRIPGLPSIGVLFIALVLLQLLRSWPTGSGLEVFKRSVAGLRPYRFEVGLAVLAAAGLGVRLLDIGHGLGHMPTDIDEHRLAESVHHFLTTGTIDHSTVEHYPGIQFWLLGAGFVLTYLGQLMSGAADGLRQIPLDTFVGAGRVVNAFIETGTIVVTALLGRAVAGRTVGLVSGVLVAGAPVALEIGTQLRSDAALVLLVAAATYAAMARLEARGRTAMVVAGALAGLAAAVKYSGVFALLPVLLAAVWTGGPSRGARVGFAVLGFGVALAVTNHYLWADIPNFLYQLSVEVAMTGSDHWSATGNPRWFYTTTLANLGVGWPLLAVGAGYAAWGMATGRRQTWLLLAFPIAYTWFMTQQPAQFARWVFPTVPFVAVAAAAGIVWVHGWLGRRSEEFPGAWQRVGRVAGVGIVAACFGPFLWEAATAISWRTQPPPYALAESWLIDHAEPGDQVLSERGSLDLSDSQLGVTRVENLGETLGGSYYGLQANQWVVVPEWWSTHAGLDQLDLVAEFRASWTLGGNRGVDYFVYAAQALRPLESSEIVFGSPDTADVLGPGWAADDSSLAGWPVPVSGGAVFLPARPGAGVEVEVLIPDGADAGAQGPIRIWIANRAVPIELIETDGERMLLRSGPIPVSNPALRVFSLYLQAADDAGPVRILKISLLDP